MIGWGIYISGVISTIVYGILMFKGYKKKYHRGSEASSWVSIIGVILQASLCSWLGLLVMYLAKKEADKENK